MLFLFQYVSVHMGPMGLSFLTNMWCRLGHDGGGQVVREVAFKSDDPSSNPAEVYIFSVKSNENEQ